MTDTKRVIFQAMIGLPFAAVALHCFSALHEVVPVHVWGGFAVIVFGSVVVLALHARGPRQAFGVSLAYAGTAVFLSPVVRLFCGQLNGKSSMTEPSALANLMAYLPQADETSGLAFIVGGAVLTLIGVLLTNKTTTNHPKRMDRRPYARA